MVSARFTPINGEPDAEASGCRRCARSYDRRLGLVCVEMTFGTQKSTGNCRPRDRGARQGRKQSQSKLARGLEAGVRGTGGPQFKTDELPAAKCQGNRTARPRTQTDGETGQARGRQG